MHKDAFNEGRILLAKWAEKLKKQRAAEISGR